MLYIQVHATLVIKCFNCLDIMDLFDTEPPHDKIDELIIFSVCNLYVEVLVLELCIRCRIKVSYHFKYNHRNRQKYENKLD